MSKITCYILPINCLSIALDAHMFSPNGHGPGTKDQCPRDAGPGSGVRHGTVQYVQYVQIVRYALYVLYVQYEQYVHIVR